MLRRKAFLAGLFLAVAFWLISSLFVWDIQVTGNYQVTDDVFYSFLEQEGIDTRVQSAITMPQVAETYIPRRAIRHMQKDRVVIFGAGAGLPYFSTDTVAAQRALEIHADEVLVAKNGVDGIYTADPNKDPNAERLYNLTYDEAMQRNIRVLDQTAFSLCRDNNVTMRVFGMQGEGNVTRAILGEKMGTLVTR